MITIDAKTEEELELINAAIGLLDDLEACTNKMFGKENLAVVCLALVMLGAFQAQENIITDKDGFLDMCERIWDASEKEIKGTIN